MPKGFQKGHEKTGGRKPGGPYVKKSESLVAARRVSRTDEAGEGEEGLVLLYRTMKEENPEGFLKELRTLEKDHQQKVASARGAGGEVASSGGVDVGTGRSVELVEKLLGEVGVK